MGKHFTNFQQEKLWQLKSEGLNYREIGAQLGLSREQVKEYFKRLRRKEKAQSLQLSNLKDEQIYKQTTFPKRSQTLRILELERENDLLRSFLYAAGRR